MAVSTRLVRWSFVAAAILLVVALVGYIGYARHKAINFITGLPKRLGVDIQSETDGFTYSQSLKDKVVFTVHAAKEITHTDGTVTLRDVGIVLYGRSGNRADRIHGAEFEFDQQNHILKAVGEALIDLDGPPGKARPAPGEPEPDRMIHVKTTGLVFLEKQRSASTDGPIEFTASGLTGNAVGATYDSGAGRLTLNSDVRVSGLRGKPGQERPMLLTAAHAVMDRAPGEDAGNIITLEQAKYVSATDSGSQTMSALHAVVHTTSAGSPENIAAQGHVVLTGAGRGTLTSERLDMTLNDAGQPSHAHLYAGVRFNNDTGVRQQDGHAADTVLTFDPQGRPVNAILTGAVELNGNAGAAAQRRLNAERVDLAFSGGGKQKVILRAAVASGGDGARLRLVDNKGVTSTNSGIRADTLRARFGPGPAGSSIINGLDGTGKTLVERLTLDARGLPLNKETTTGDTLAVDLKPGQNGHMVLSNATQRGSVTVVREAAARKPNQPPDVEHASGDTAVYNADSDHMTLTGAVEVTDPTSTLFADTVAIDRTTGDATAQGAVRVNYAQAPAPGHPPGEPIHILADHAVSHKATGVTEFTAQHGTRLRMWQAGSQVEAPILDLDRTHKTILARGSDPADPAPVRVILSGDTAAPNPAPTAGKRAAKAPAGPIRILSQTMTYSDATRQVDFHGQVRVTESDGTMHAQNATVFLAPATTAAAQPAQGFLGGKVDHVIGTGAVELQEPGRRATGEKITYTAADETYILTGTKATPPRLVDETRGAVTGAQLRFKSGDDSVEIIGGDGGRVRSEPRVKQ